MARRATFLQSLREQSQVDKDDVLAIAGFYEFKGLRGGKKTEGSLTKLLQAYATMNYDLGVLSKDVFENSGPALPKNWLLVADQALTRKLAVLDLQVGVLIFPQETQSADWPELLESIINKASQLEKEVDLCIGLSPWGKARERELLEKSPDLFDLLLGSGPGGAVKNQLVGDRPTIWMRPYNEGKMLNKVTFQDLESLRDQSGRLSRASLRTETVVLSDSFEADPEIKAIFNH